MALQALNLKNMINTSFFQNQDLMSFYLMYMYNTWELKKHYEAGIVSHGRPKYPVIFFIIKKQIGILFL